MGEGPAVLTRAVCVRHKHASAGGSASMKRGPEGRGGRPVVAKEPRGVTREGLRSGSPLRLRSVKRPVKEPERMGDATPLVAS